MRLRTLFLIVLAASAGFASGFRSDVTGGIIHCVACLVTPVLAVVLWRQNSGARQLAITMGLLLLLEAFRFIPLRFGPVWAYISADHQAQLWLGASFAAPFGVGPLAVGIARLFVRGTGSLPLPIPADIKAGSTRHS